MTPLDMAEVIIRSIEIREKSFDWIEYYQDSIINHLQLKRIGEDPQFHNTIWDFKKYVKIPLEKAIERALLEAEIDLKFHTPISLAFHWQNDLYDWAKDIQKQQLWEYAFISHTLDTNQYNDGWKKYTIWDETQIHEIGRYDTWAESVFWLRRYAAKLNSQYLAEWGSKLNSHYLSCNSGRINSGGQIE